MTTYCVSIDEGKNWVKIAGTNIRDAKRSAQLLYPAVVYGTSHIIGEVDLRTEKIKIVAKRKPQFNKRATWFTVY